MSKNTKYSRIAWTAEDVKSKKPEWSYKQCEEWLVDNEKYLTEAGIQAGWEVMDAILPSNLKEFECPF